MSKIYNLPVSYRISRIYVLFVFKNFYSKVHIIGKENIPVNEKIIFAPNHRNALMDAIAILYIAPKNIATVFLARSDMFKKKFVAKILHYTKIMPAYRIRDGIENLGKNTEIFEKSVEVLDNKNAFCIMPEGNQETEKNIRPLVKGIFRIAFAAQLASGSKKDVKIVPVGIDLGHFHKFGKHLIVNIGQPIEVADYYDDYMQNANAAINNIKQRLRGDLETLIVNIASEKYYESFDAILEMVALELLSHKKQNNNTQNNFYTKQEAASLLVEIERNSPEKVEKIDVKAKAYKTLIQNLKLRESDFHVKHNNAFKKLVNIILLILLFPVFLTGFIYNILPFQVPVIIRKRMKVKYDGFYSSLHYGISVLTFPIFYLLEAWITVLIAGISSWWIFLILILEYIFGKWAFLYFKKYKSTKAAFHLSSIKKDKKSEFEKAELLRKEIISLVFEHK